MSGLGDNTTSGKRYELAVFMDTLLNNNNKNVDLGIEIRFADNWDDLAVRNNKSEYIFSQIKLVDDVNVNIINSQVLLGEHKISLKEHDFDLKKYFKSYLRIKDQFKSRNNSEKIKKLIVFTTARFDQTELQQKVGTIESIGSNNYKINSVKLDFLEKIKDVKSDFDILIEQLAEYIMKNVETMDFNRNKIKNSNNTTDHDIFSYYHRALIDEKVIEIFDYTVGSKKTEKRGRFTPMFINKEAGMSPRAKTLRSELNSFLEKKKHIPEMQIKKKMEVDWKVSKDFDKKNTTDKIFLPNYDINEEKGVEEFFDLLEWKVNQPDVKSMLKKLKDVEIKEKFLEYYTFQPNYIEYLINNFVQDGWKKWKNQPKSKEAWILNDDITTFVKQLKCDISRPKAAHMTEKYENELKGLIKTYDLYYKEESLILEKDLAKLTTIITESNILSSIKLLQSFGKNYFFINLERLYEKTEIIELLNAFQGHDQKIFILSYQYWDKNIESELEKKVRDILKDPSKKIIFLTTEGELPLSKISSERNEYDDNKLGLQYLKDSSTLLEHKIIIQDQPLMLNDFINEQNYDIIDAKVIDMLINNQEINIGRKPLGIADLVGAYSEFESIEEVDTKTLFDKLILTESEDVYIISGISGPNKEKCLTEYLKNNVEASKQSMLKNVEDELALFNKNNTEILNHRILLADCSFEENYFKKVCQNNSKRMVYWIDLKTQNSDPKLTLEQIYNPNFYLESHRLSSEVIIDKKIKFELMSSRLSDVYVISGTNKTEFMHWLELNNGDEKEVEKNCNNNKIIFDDYAMIQQLIGKCPTVHFFKFDNKHLIWCKSDGTKKNLIKYRGRETIYTVTKQIMKEHEFANQLTNKRNIIIAADPGMGKSTTLIHVCSKYYLERNGKSSPWVIIANLKDHLQEIKTIDLIKDSREIVISKVLEYFSCVDESLQDNFASRVLRAAILDKEFPKPLIVAFDGFDEVLDEVDRNNVLSLLKFLQDETKVKFFVTTRLHYEPTLESALSTFAMRLIPMDDPTIRIFIRNYLKTRLHLMLSQDEYTKTFINEKSSNEKMSEYFKSFLTKIQDLFKRDVSWFIGTPLQLYLTLESCATHFKQWVKDGMGLIPDFNHLNGNVCDIYERFINRKYNIFYKKFNIEEGLKILHKMNFDEYHRQIANFIILKSHLNKFIESSKHLVQSAGITRYVNGNIEFIHPTFAEYYVTETFMHWIDKWKREDSFYLMNSNKQKYFIKNILLKEDYRIERAYLNCRLSKQCVKNVKLNENYYDAQLLFVAVREVTVEIMRFILYNFSCVTLAVKNTVLYRATYLGNLDMIKLVVSEGAEVNTIGKFVPITDLSPLYCAITRNYNFDVVKFLVEEGRADVRARDLHGNTVLHLSIRHDDLRILELFLDNGADINAESNHGMTPLHLACRGSNYKLVEFLLSRSANLSIQVRDRYDCTALHYAMENKYDNLDVIKLLVERGAHVKGAGPLILHLNYNPRAVKFLIENGADVGVRDRSGRTLLHCASERSELDIVQCLLDKGADFRAVDNHGRTVLHSASKARNRDVVELLIPKFKNVDAQDNIGRTALHYATKFHRWDTVKFLVENGAKVNVKTNHGRTVLHSVLERSSRESNNSDMIKFLEKQRVHICDRDNNGRTILHSANQRDKSDIMEFLCNNIDVNAKDYDGNTTLHLATMRGDLHMVRYLLNKSANVDADNDNGMTALHLATSRNDLDLVEILIEKGANASAKNKSEMTALDLALSDGYGDLDIIQFLKDTDAHDSAKVKSDATALHSASHGGDWNEVERLVKNGADVNAKAHIGRTVLHLASMLGSLEIVEFLVDRVADINAKTNHGRTALHYACKGSNLDVVEFLVDKIADIDAQTNHGRTALHSASQLDNKFIAKFLLDKGAVRYKRDRNRRTAVHHGIWRDKVDTFILRKQQSFLYDEDEDKNGTTLFCLASYTTLIPPTQIQLLISCTLVHVSMS